MPIAFRKYTPIDKKELTNCLALLQDHVAKIDPLKILRRAQVFDAKNYLKQTLKLVKSNQGVIFFAENEDKIVGCIIAIKENAKGLTAIMNHPNKTAEILELYVMPDYRGQNIGRSLIKKVENHYKKLGCANIRISSFAPNTKATDLYHYLGYKDRVINMIKRL